ncbi:MAG: hypothetical protein KAX49_12725 [Halanaerobiales bacterium]|nr:hypothetical protein [Halanaerobiales bacterium]
MKVDSITRKRYKQVKKIYEEILGQKIVGDFGVTVGFASGFSIWQVDQADKAIYGERKSSSNDEESKNAVLYFGTENMDEIEKELLQLDITLIHSVKEEEWGEKVIRLYDPEGHVIEICE